MECAICANYFDRSTYRPMLGTCGHTVCQQCRLQLRRPNHFTCPSCLRLKSFLVEATNYQLLECLEHLDEVNKTHENVTKNHFWDLSELQNVISGKQKELEERERVIARMQHEQQEMIAAEEVYRDSLFRCCDCRVSVSSMVGRLCLDCGKEGGTIERKADGEAVVKQLEKAESAVLCPTCFLDGAHMGHKSLPFLTVKLTGRAANEFTPLLADVKQSDIKMEKSCWSVEEMYSRISPLVGQLRQLAVKQRSEADFEDLLDVGRRFSKGYAEVAARMEHCAKLFVDQTSKLVLKLADVIEDEKEIQLSNSRSGVSLIPNKQ